jgi:hypothetical protein
MKIQLKRSGVLDGAAAKKPSAEQMEYGELAVNYNNGDPAVFLKDSNDTIIRIAGKGATGLDGDYVNIAGDTMTGALQVSGDPASGETGVRLETSGGVGAGRTTGTQAVYRGFNAPSTTPTFEVLANGSASFATKVTTADFDSNHPTDGRFGRYNWAGVRWTDTSGNNVIRLDADGGGSASFAGGDCYIKDDGRVRTNAYYESFRTEAGGALFTGGLGTWDAQTDVNVKILANGSAEFAGDVQTGERIYRTGKTGFYLDSSYILPVLNGVASTAGTVNFGSDVYPWGSATFAGQVTATVNNSSGTEAAIKAVQTNANGYALWCGSGPDAADRSAYILPDGSATFAGTLTVDENINGLKAISGSGSGSASVIRVYSDTLSKYTTNLNADGSAEFAGGGFKIYSSGAIDANSIGIGTPGNYPIVLSSDGSATFDGDCSFANNKVSAFTSSNNGLVRINDSSGTTVLDLNGTNGTVSAGSTTTRGQYRGICPSSVTASAATFLDAQYNGTSAAFITYDGAATFAGSLKSTGYFVNRSSSVTDSSVVFFASKNDVGRIEFDLGGNGTFVGNVNASNFNSTSDISLKKDIAPVSNALARICNITGVNFTWKETGVKTIGVVAQNVEEEFPELVETADVKRVNYNGLIGVLIEAVKELQAEVTQLKSGL